MITNNGFLCVTAGGAVAAVFLRSLLSLLLVETATVDSDYPGPLLRDFFLFRRLRAGPFVFNSPAMVTKDFMMVAIRLICLQARDMWY